MKKYIILGTILILFGLGWFIYKQTTYTHIKVEFDNLRPSDERMPVYFKGIMIGRAKEKKHGFDFKHTYITLVLYPKKLMLPVNTEVLLKKLKKNKKEMDFIELIYPENPSKELISDGSILKGKATVDIEEYLKNQHPDDIEIIKENLTSASENLNYSLEGLSELFVLLQDTVKENQQNINGVTKNIYQVSSKLNKSVKQESLDNTISSLETTAENIDRITQNFTDTTTNLNNKMIPQIDSSIQNTREILANTNAISCGIRQTLRKRFGGLRLIFGKTINESECKACGR